MPRVGSKREEGKTSSSVSPLAGGKRKQQAEEDVCAVSGGGAMVDLERLGEAWARASRGETYTYSNEEAEGRRPQKLSAFRRRVLAQCAAVPRGKITTYARIAQRIGCASCQAVGQALKMNPFSPIVPCHRVVKADLSIGGFHGAKDPASPEIRRKVAKLKAEGVVFVMDKTGKYVLVDKSCVV